MVASYFPAQRNQQISSSIASAAEESISVLALHFYLEDSSWDLVTVSSIKYSVNILLHNVYNAFILGLLYKYVLKMLIVNFKQFFLT